MVDYLNAGLRDNSNVGTYSYVGGNLASVERPDGRVTSYSYDTTNTNADLRHDLLTTTGPNAQAGGPDAGDASVNAYDSSGRIVSQTDPAGNETTFSY